MKLSYWVGVVVSKPRDKRSTYPVDFSELLSSTCSFPITVFCARCLRSNPSFVSRGGRNGGVTRAGVSEHPDEDTLKKAHLAFPIQKCNGLATKMLILQIYYFSIADSDEGLAPHVHKWGEECTLKIIFVSSNLQSKVPYLALLLCFIRSFDIHKKRYICGFSTKTHHNIVLHPPVFSRRLKQEQGTLNLFSDWLTIWRYLPL